MYDKPELPHDFVSLPYANPKAKKGGTLKIGAVGSFDSLNPHIVKGRSPWQLRFWCYETLWGEVGTNHLHFTDFWQNQSKPARIENGLNLSSEKKQNLVITHL